MRQTSVKNLLAAHAFDLKLQLVQGHDGLDRIIGHPRVQKSGLILSGLLDLAEASRIQVFGKTEILYLKNISLDDQKNIITGLFARNIPCLVLSNHLLLDPLVLQHAKHFPIPILHSSLGSSTLITRLHGFLDEELSSELSVHGVMVDVFGVGVLLKGQSGIGKSECALDLVLRGHSLVADDVVVIKRRDKELVGFCSHVIKYHMEVRGLGIINIRELFGTASVCARKRLDLIVEMVEWQDRETYERLGLDDNSESILGLGVNKICIPIRPGRNIASIIEVAARDQILKRQGYHAARRFQSYLEKNILRSSV